MRHFTIVLAFILLIPVHAVSQVPNPDIQWTADWEVDQDVAIMQIDSDSYNFELILEFWINNNRVTPIEVNFDVEFEEVEFEVDDPGQVSISGNSNETFEITITGSALESQSASDDQILYNSDEFRETVSLSLKSINNFPLKTIKSSSSFLWLCHTKLSFSLQTLTY